MASVVPKDVEIGPEAGDQLFEWRDLSVSIGGRTLLQPFSGHATAGELFAIFGPSGAGKTTMLGALTGDREPSTGEVLLAGRAFASASRRVPDSERRVLLREVAYVRQRDIFMENLTVQDTLDFSARLRLPRELSHAAKRERVSAVIRDLGLEDCAHTSIGSTMQRGVSGGELKRANIANELLARPRVLVCDEPTSGLDSSSALTVMRMLRDMARAEGCALICSIHQPSSQIAALVDRALLLAPGGRVAYMGPGQGLHTHLASIGYPRPEGYTTVDYAMELLTNHETARELVDRWPGPHEQRTAAAPSAEDAGLGRGGALTFQPRPAGPDFCEQAAVLMQRQVRNARGTLLARNEVVLNILVGLVSGLVWWQAAADPSGAQPGRRRDVLGAIFFFLAHMAWWPLFLYLFSFPAERAVLAKERRAGSYSIEAYALAKSLSEVPQEMVCPSLFFLVALPMVGFTPAGAAVMWAVCLAQYQTSAGIGMLVSIIAPAGDSNMVASTAMTYQMCAGGFLISPSYLPPALRWLPYTSVWHYSGALLTRAAFGEPDENYSQLGAGLDSVLLVLFVVAIKVAIYLALKFSRKLEFE